jgi:cell shape-determining protein MreC
VTNNKKLIFLFIIIIITFALVYFFPSIGSKIRINFYSSKDLIYKPFKALSEEVTNYFKILNTNNQNIEMISNLKNENTNLKEINNMLINSLSKFNELNYLLFDELENFPKSTGVNIIGNKNHLIQDMFIIDKGFASGISIGDYLVSSNNIIGRVKEVNFNYSEVVGILNLDYGDEIIIDNKSYIVSGTDDKYLRFVRRKDSTEVFSLKSGDIAKIKINNHYLNLGSVKILNDNFVIIPKLTTSYSTARVVISD